MNDTETNYFTWSVINTMGIVIAYGFTDRLEALGFIETANDKAYVGCTVELISKTLIDSTYFRNCKEDFTDKRAGEYDHKEKKWS